MNASVVRLGLAWVHLTALAIGVGGVWSRASALREFIRHPAAWQHGEEHVFGYGATRGARGAILPLAR